MSNLSAEMLPRPTHLSNYQYGALLTREEPTPRKFLAPFSFIRQYYITRAC